MNPSAIPSSTPTVSVPPKRFSTPESSAPDQPFSQVLSREIADKSPAANAEAHVAKEASAPPKAADSSETPNASQSDSSGTTESAAPAAVVASSLAAEQMLMMAAQIVPSPTLPATASAEAPPQFAQARTDVALLAGMLPDAALTDTATDVNTTNQTTLSLDKAVGRNFEQSLSRTLDQTNTTRLATAEVNQPTMPTATNTPIPGKVASNDAVNILANTFADATADTGAESTPAMAVSMAPLQQAAAHQAPAVKTGADRIAPYVGTPGWDKAIGQRVVWMISAEQQSASLTLNPPDLGPLQVVLNVSSTQANASFYAAQPEVRQAIEAALPKLREMLEDAGIQLGQANVSAGTPQQQEAYSGAPAQFISSQAAPNASLNAPPAVTETRRIVREGLIDTFA